MTSTTVVPFDKPTVAAVGHGMEMRYEEHDKTTDTPTGRSATFSGVEFEALIYKDLASQRLGAKVTIALKWQNARIVESSIPDLTVNDVAAGSAILRSNLSSRTVGLIRDGWLPSGLALDHDTIVLPDRCAISELCAHFRNGTKRNSANHDFLDLLEGRPIRINPMLFALEGNLKSNPSPTIVEQQLREARTKIKAALPKAILVPDDDGSLMGVVGIITDTQKDMARKEELLMRAAAMLRAPVSARRFPMLWKEILVIADDCHVPRSSLVNIALLSAIAVPNGKSPARALLKLTHPNYSRELAYNALADLRSLEVLIELFSVFPKERIMFCTSDRDLALFWCGIRASDFSWSDNASHFKLSPVEALLPNMTEEERLTVLRDVANT